MDVGRGLGCAHGCAPSVRQRMVQLCLLRDRAERLHGRGPQVEVAVSTGDYESDPAGSRGRVLQDGVLGRRPVRLVQQSVAVVGGGWGKPKRVPGVLSAHPQAVLKPSQEHLVDHVCRARGDSGGPLAICVLQKVEDDLSVHRMDPQPVDAVLHGEGGGQSLPVGHRARDGHCPRAGKLGGEGDTGGVPAGSAPRRVGGGVAPGLGDPVVPGGAEPPRVEVGGVPSDVGLAGTVAVDHAPGERDRQPGAGDAPARGALGQWVHPLLQQPAREDGGQLHLERGRPPHRRQQQVRG